MKFAALALLISAQSALALEISFLNGIAKVTSEKTIEISNVSLIGQNKKAKLQLTWNSVSNSFDLSDLQEVNVGAFVGKWDTQIQNDCVGAFSKYSSMEFKPDGSCIDSSGMKCKWTSAGSSLNVIWPDYPQYVITLDLVHGELVGKIVESGARKWCLRGTFKGL